jgi:hypothetical protein
MATKEETSSQMPRNLPAADCAAVANQMAVHTIQLHSTPRVIAVVSGREDLKAATLTVAPSHGCTAVVPAWKAM